MFGCLRLLLETRVAGGHFRFIGDEANFKCAVWAVVLFFMLSGSVMTALLQKNYNSIGIRTLYFYLDRGLRIFPQFTFFMFITLFFNHFMRFSTLENLSATETFTFEC